MIATVQLQDLPTQSQLWIYQSNKPFEDDEYAISEQLERFIQNWESHGSPVTGAYEIINNQFIIVAANAEDSPSGCSIDSSVKVIREIESEFGYDLLNKGLIAFENEGIQLVGLPDIPSKISAGELTADTIIYNNAINTVGQFKDNWKIKAQESWMKRYF